MAELPPTPNLQLQPIEANRKTWADIMNNNLLLIDAIVGSFYVVNNLQGVWENSKVYEIGQAVVDQTSAVIYQVLEAHTSASIPTTFAEDRAARPHLWGIYSSPATARGTWIPNTVYAVNDFVISGTKYAICVQAHTSGAIFEDDVAAGKWSVLIDLSEAGSTIMPVPGGLADKNKFVVINATGTGYSLVTSNATLTLLGATSIGSALFTAGSQAVARAAINAAEAGAYQPDSPTLTALNTAGIGAEGTALHGAGTSLQWLGGAAVVENIAALKALTIRPKSVYVLGASSIADGAQGLFHWVAGSGATADDVNVVNCAVGTAGRYIRSEIYQPDLVRKAGTILGAGLEPYESSIVASDDYSAFPIIRALQSGVVACLYYHGRNHGQSDPEAIALPQAVAIAGDLVIDGNEASGGVATSIAGVLASITSTADDSTVNFTIYGEYPLGTAVSDVVTGVNTNRVFSSQKFAKVTQIAVDAACTGDISAGLWGVPGDVELKTSSDGGYTWSAANKLFDGTTSGLYLYYGQSLGVTKTGELVANAAKINLATGSVTPVYRRSYGSGTLWGPETTITFSGYTPTGTMNLYGEGKLTPSGKLVFTGYTSTQSVLCVSSDDGASYVRSLILEDAVLDPSETALAILDEQRFIVIHRVAAVSKMRQQMTSDGGATWTAAALVEDTLGTITNFAYVSPQMVTFEENGLKHVALMPFPREASSGVYDKEACLVIYYALADEVFSDTTQWKARQVLVDGGTLLGRSGYPSMVVNPITKRILCAYSHETANRANSIKTIGFNPGQYITFSSNSVSLNSITLGGGTDQLNAYVAADAWTPLITGSTGGSANAYSLQSGFYTRIGNRVIVDFDLRVSGAMNSTGDLRLSGLPYTAKNNISKAFIESGEHVAGAAPQYLKSVINETYAEIRHLTTTAFGNVAAGDVTSDYRISGTFSYTTDDAP